MSQHKDIVVTKTARVIRPPDYPRINGPVIFLAGPIQGAPDWQSGAIEFLKYDPNINIASPRTYTDLKTDNTDWKHYYLNRAGRNGVILFWLAREEEHFCERAYAQTSRFELGRHFGLALCRKKVNIVVGIEPGFLNEHYLRKTISKLAPSIAIFGAFDKTCLKALELARK